MHLTCSPPPSTVQRLHSLEAAQPLASSTHLTQSASLLVLDLPGYDLGHVILGFQALVSLSVQAGGCPGRVLAPLTAPKVSRFPLHKPGRAAGVPQGGWGEFAGQGSFLEGPRRAPQAALCAPPPPNQQLWLSLLPHLQPLPSRAPPARLCPPPPTTPTPLPRPGHPPPQPVPEGP